MGSITSPQGVRLEAALDAAHVRYITDHPLSKKSHDEACLHMPGGNTRTVLYATPFPITVSSGRSCYLTTVDGHEYVDFLGEYSAGIYGHNHPIIKKAIQETLDKGWNYGAHNVMERKLAATVCRRFPSIELVRFVNSGTEANMMALATALAYTGKRKVLVFQKGYHGSTICGKPPSAKKSINLPHEFEFGVYNDIQGTKDLIGGFPEHSLAAILVEPMLGSGGCLPASVEFLKTLRDLATQHKALLIIDEVMTSRLSYHGLHTDCNIVPDLVTLGKWVGGGMSFGAFGGREDIMSLYDPRRGELEHPGTFNNNVFSMTAGVAGCELLDEKCLERLNGMGRSLLQALRDILRKYEITGTMPESPVTDELQEPDHPRRPPRLFVQGVGSLLCVQFAGPERDLLQGIFYHHMLRGGYHMAQRGFIALNIELEESHLQGFSACFERFCEEWKTVLRW